MVENDSARKGFFVVTFIAIRAELPAMDVVTLMAGDAAGIHLSKLGGTRMARLARHLAVGLAERKSGALGVVEAEIGPFRRPVTVAALGAKAAGVHIFARVAFRAILGELSFPGRLPVAGDAVRPRMGADQRKPALLLVIEALLEP